MIEKVQRRATKLIHEIKDLTYNERLKYLGLPSLKARRIRGDLIQCYKIFSNTDDLDISDFFKLSHYDRTRNSTNKIFIEHCSTNIRKFSFSNRIAPLWNKLTTVMKSACDTNKFKNLLDNWENYKAIKYDYDD